MRGRGKTSGEVIVRQLAIVLGVLVAGCGSGLALNPSLDISQYGHTAWTIRNGFIPGTAYAMAQTPDGYLWLGTEFGLFRFDGVHSVPWQPPAGERLPDSPYSLLVSRDGTLWIGTFAGLLSWSGGKLTRYPEVGAYFITSLLEDHEGTVWAGTLETPKGRLCAIRNGHTQCYGQDGAFGGFAWTLFEDGSGSLWVGAESGLWRWKPAPPRHYAIAGKRIDDLTAADDGRVLIAMREAGLRHLVGDGIEAYPIRSASNPIVVMPDRDVNSNKLLRDRDGGLWIGTHQRGLIHVHHGRTDVFGKSDGLSGDIIAGLFEDREGNIWVSTAGGLDRFRDLPVTTVSARQGLPSDAVMSVLAATDGSVWIGTADGLARWKNGEVSVFRRANGLPDDAVQSLYQDEEGRIWVFTGRGLAWFNTGRFVAVNGGPSREVYSITGDKAGNLWLSGDRGLSHLLERRFIENIPWSVLGRRQQAKVILPDPGGLWLAFWLDGGVEYFKDGRVRASYTAADGLGKGPVASIRLDREGAVWAATQFGGLSRIKDGRVTTLTTASGLPCDKIHWTTEDDNGSLWLYTGCGLVHIRRSEVDAWMADPKRWVETTVWDAVDGVMPEGGPSYFGPTFAISAEGKLWFPIREGVAFVDLRHPVLNRLPPPVHIEQIMADGKPYQLRQSMHLPANVRDVEIEFAALSLAAPEKVHFKYKLEGQDQDWREVLNVRHAQYTNLPPNSYRFRVIACNNSGVWNETGDALDFSIDPAYYQTDWFRTLYVVAFLALLWVAFQLRVRYLQHQLNMASEARLNERMRIARELHDNLLQTVQGFMLRLQAVNEIMPPGAAKNDLEETLEVGDRAIVEGRKTVQDLRSLLTTSSLVDAIRSVGDELAGTSSAIFRLVVEGPVRDLNPIVRDEVYSIAREALRNAFTHACATHIDAEITFDKHLLRLRIMDDGKGMAPEVEQGCSGHYGLAGMRERARQIGSKLVILSGVGTGTEIDLGVAGPIAYAKSSGSSRFRWLRRMTG